MRCRSIGPEEKAFYQDQGYLAVDGVLSAERLAALRAETDRVVAAAAGVSQHDAVYDLEDSHSPAAPRVRRIKSPHDNFAFYGDMARDPAILDHIAALIGDSIRLYGGKVNMKSAGYGAPVEWHQDWAFYPHTNNDVLTAVILLDDMDEANGALRVLPQSHKGPVYDHHHDGRFCGAMDVEAEGVDVSKAVALTGRAGDMLIFHARCIHGSAVNGSNRPRRVLIWEYTAADAWPLTGPKGTYEEFQNWVVRGTASAEIRVEAVPVRLPYPAAEHGGSIYENQKGAGRRSFETYEAKRARAAT
jgi:phytanoyl-CoA hydroxylase